MRQPTQVLLVLVAVGVTMTLPARTLAQSVGPASGRSAAEPPGPAPLAGEGYVDLQCIVTATGTMTNCRVLHETPKGQGFGEAALKMSTIFKMKPPTKDGRPVRGAVWSTRIRFKAPGTPSVEPGPGQPTPRP